MDTVKMTIHRALAELKLIDSRIEKAIEVMTPTGSHQEGKLVNGTTSKEDFIKDVKAKHQSVTDLIERKHKIKSAITTANGSTFVEIGGKEMTISDAINFRSIVSAKKMLIQKLQSQHRSVLADFTRRNEEVNKVALENAKIMLGKQDEGNVKATDDDVKAIVDPYVKRMEFRMIDPLEVELLIEDLQEEVDNFEVEVDAVLSEINAITMLEI